MDAGSRDSSTCLELALEGERLCKGGDFAGGIAFFEAAIKVGTSDMRTLSAIYSQLGNAYFYLNNYEKALNFHQLDLAIAKSVVPLLPASIPRFPVLVYLFSLLLCPSVVFVSARLSPGIPVSSDPSDRQSVHAVFAAACGGEKRRG